LTQRPVDADFIVGAVLLWDGSFLLSEGSDVPLPESEMVGVGAVDVLPLPSEPPAQAQWFLSNIACISQFAGEPSVAKMLRQEALAG